MAENQLSFDIKIGGNQDQALGSLKKQLREAQQDVQALSDKFGATSQEAVNAAKRAAELKDRIGDAKSLTDAFNPDAKFKSLTASLSGVAGGFAAAQGAIALFGVESKEVEQALLRVQSAMALSQGLQAVGESIDSFKQLGANIKNSTIFIKANEMANKAAAFAMKLFGVSVETTSTSFKVLKGAIAATGLGLLVVAIGEIVAAFQNYSSAAEKAAEKQNEFNKRVTEGAKTALKAEQQNLANLEKLDIAKAKSRGASEKEIFEIEQGYRRQKAQAQVRFFEETKNADKQAAKEAKDEIDRANVEGQVALLDFQTKQAAARKAKAKEAGDALAEQEAARLEKQLNDEKKLTEQLLEEYDKRRGIANKAKTLSQKELNALDEQERVAEEEKNNKKFDAQISFLGKTTNFTLQGIQQQQKANADAKEAEAKIDKISAEQKIALAQQTASALMAVSDVLGKETAAGKALAISAALINTYQGISAGVKLGFPAAIPAVALAAATGFSAVKNIIATKVPGAASGGGANMTAPSVSASAPITPPQPQAATTNLSSQTINAIGNQAVRAYVVENDVTSNQQRIAAIQQRARFG